MITAVCSADISRIYSKHNILISSVSDVGVTTISTCILAHEANMEMEEESPVVVSSNVEASVYWLIIFTKKNSAWVIKPLPASRVDGSIISLGDVRRWALKELTAVCVRVCAAGNKCSVCRPENTWCSAAAHHATAPQSVTHKDNRCHVQRPTSSRNIWEPKQPRSSQRPHTAKTRRMQEGCDVQD